MLEIRSTTFPYGTSRNNQRIQKLYEIVQEAAVSFKKEFTLLTIFIKKYFFISYNRDNIYNNYNKSFFSNYSMWIELVALSRLLPSFKF